jgi:chromosome segregation ATPase
MTDSNKIAFDRERREIIMKFDTEIKRLEYDNKMFKDSNEAKNREIQELQYRVKQMQQSLEDEMNNNQKYSELQVTIKEYENRFNLVGQEI